MATHFKAGQLVVRGDGHNAQAKIKVEDTDLVFECIDTKTGLPRYMSLTSLFDRLDELEKTIAEMILLGEKKDG